MANQKKEKFHCTFPNQGSEILDFPVLRNADEVEPYKLQVGYDRLSAFSGIQHKRTGYKGAALPQLQTVIVATHGIAVKKFSAAQKSFSS